PNVWACRDKQGGVQILLWDYTHPDQNSPNAQFFVRDWPAKAIAPAQLIIKNLSPGKHQAKITRVGYRHNDVYTAYLDLAAPGGQPNAPSLLPDEQLATLRNSCTGIPEIRSVTVDQKGSLQFDLSLNENDAYLIEIEQ